MAKFVAPATIMNVMTDAEEGGCLGLPCKNRSYQPYLKWDHDVEHYLSEAFGKERLEAITEALCHPPKASCLRVNTLTTTSHEVVRRLEQVCAVWETDGFAAFHCGEHELVPGVVMVKGSGPHAVKYTDCNGKSLPEVLVSRKCGEAVLRGAEAFVPGILACETGVNAGDEVAVSMFVENEGDPPTRGTTLSSALEAASQLPNNSYSTPAPEAPVDACTCQLSEARSHSNPSEPSNFSTSCQQSLHVHEASFSSKPSCSSHPSDSPPLDSEAVLRQSEISQPSHVTDSSTPPFPLAPCQASQASQSRNRWFIGRGKALLSRAAMFRQEQGVAVEITHRVYRHPSLHTLTTEWVEGVFLQHLPSVIAAHVLGPRPGERILDMCASPGGKTTAIAILMQDRGEIVALDRSQTKVRQIASLAGQMGLTCIKAFKMDATCCVQDPSEAKPDLSPEQTGQVLADVTSRDAATAGGLGAAQASEDLSPLEKYSDKEPLGDGVSERFSQVGVADGSRCDEAEIGNRVGLGLGCSSPSFAVVNRESAATVSHVDTSTAPSESSPVDVMAVSGGQSGQRDCETPQDGSRIGIQTEQASSSRRVEVVGSRGRTRSSRGNMSSINRNSGPCQIPSTDSRDTDRGAAHADETGLVNRNVSDPGIVTASGPSQPTFSARIDTAHRRSSEPLSPKPSQVPPEATATSNAHEAEPKPPTCAKPSKPFNGGDRRGTPGERRAARKEARWLRSNQTRLKSEKLEPGSFDRVLLDAPCSALGLRPRLFVRGVSLQSLRQDGVYKRRFLDQAVRLVKPGGVIVYSTCTFNPGENEALVRYALDTYPCLRLVPQEPRLGGPGLVGGVFDGTGYREWLREGEQNLVQRFDPDCPLDTIGFFIAKFQKALLGS